MGHVPTDREPHTPPDDNDETEYLGARDLASWPSRWGRKLADPVVGAAVGFHRHMDKRSIPYAVLLTTAIVGVLVAGVLTAVSAEIYDNVTDRGGVAGLDRPVLNQMIAWRSGGLNQAVTDFTDLGSTTVMPFIATASALLLAWWWRRWTPLLLMAIAAGGSVLLTVVGKQTIDRARPARSLAVPPFETSPSFPSGHTLNTWVIALLVAYLVCLRLDAWWGRVAAAVGAVVFALTMGLSRVYLGHHWLTDVLVGFTLGSAWLIVVITGHRLALSVLRRQKKLARQAKHQNQHPGSGVS